MGGRFLKFSSARRSRSASASSGLTQRSNVTPHEQATVRRYPFRAGQQLTAMNLCWWTILRLMS